MKIPIQIAALGVAIKENVTVYLSLQLTLLVEHLFIQKVRMSCAEAIILNWFEITPDEAKLEALDIYNLIGDHGADSGSSSILEKAIYKSLGSRYPWKNLQKKRDFEADAQLTERSYNVLINRKNLR